MKPIKILSLLGVVFTTSCCYTQPKEGKPYGYLDKEWKEVAVQMPNEWYGTIAAKQAADSVLKYQTKIGGWPKNTNFHSGPDQEDMDKVKSSGIGATFDNGATITELGFLAKMYSNFTDERYKKAFEKGLNYIFVSQYKNGGWPQFFPVRKGSVAYSGHITYNDDAMVNTMNFLHKIISGDKAFASLKLEKDIEEKADKAYKKGVECILDTQIIINGKPTVWCAQHDAITLAPANARSYELASFSGSESVGIVLLLMEIENPSKEIIASIKGAVDWFENHKVKGLKIETEIDQDGNENRIVVKDKNAPILWARFYDLETEEPFFCDRDGIKKSSLADIGYNRRNGYSWYTQNPAKIVTKYQEWSVNYQ
tara:strand:- start:1174 stop:2277 length:1104 start_codon:yes stop_codon:yes gene_type:complete